MLRQLIFGIWLSFSVELTKFCCKIGEQIEVKVSEDCPVGAVTCGDTPCKKVDGNYVAACYSGDSTGTICSYNDQCESGQCVPYPCQYESKEDGGQTYYFCKCGNEARRVSTTPFDPGLCATVMKVCL